MNNSSLSVAHLNYINAPGVIRKLREEARAAENGGLPMHFFVISSEVQNADEGKLHFRTRKAAVRTKGRLRFLFRLFTPEDLITPYLDPREFDVFIIRFGKVFLGHGYTYKKYGSKIVTEHHTNEIAELLLKPTLSRRILAWASLRRSRRALEGTRGFIGVTREILAVEQAKVRTRKPEYLFPNGVSVENRLPVSPKDDTGQSISLIFAAAEFQAWQGLDRVLKGLSNYNNPKRKIFLHIAGIVSKENQRLIDSLSHSMFCSVIMHGLLLPEKLYNLYAKMHCAIASLSLSRKKMKEACPLKTREYLAWGIPVIYGYKDPDLPEDFPWGLRIPDDENPVDFNKLVDFVDRLYREKDISAKIFEYAHDNLDWKPKLLGLYVWLKKLMRR